MLFSAIFLPFWSKMPVFAYLYIVLLRFWRFSKRFFFLFCIITDITMIAPSWISILSREAVCLFWYVTAAGSAKVALRRCCFVRSTSLNLFLTIVLLLRCKGFRSSILATAILRCRITLLRRRLLFSFRSFSTMLFVERCRTRIYTIIYYITCNGLMRLTRDWRTFMWSS